MLYDDNFRHALRTDDSVFDGNRQREAMRPTIKDT
jgi:hypothetical protein